MLRVILVLLVLIVLILGGATVGVYQYLSPEEEPPRLASPSSARSTISGDIIGFQGANDAHAWLGIPYADAARWRSPRPKVPWDTRREMLDYGIQCPQLPAVPDSDSGRGYIGEESCLSLNVWAPPFHPEIIPEGSERLPVMVWLHGGGNTIGSGGSDLIKAYDGSLMATENDVIVVTINYRLGPFGWFMHPAIEETSPTPLDASGNYGTLDMIAALEWVKLNIASFGGDPDNVTIYGESAGGYNVLSLMASPIARGLFHRAIVQSGRPTLYSKTDAMDLKRTPAGSDMWGSKKMVAHWMMNAGRAADFDDAIAQQAEMEPAELANWLRSLSASEIFTIFDSRFAGMVNMPLIIGDGHVMPAMTAEEIFSDPNNYAPVPMMIGTTRDETRLFMAFDPNYVKMTANLPTEIIDVEAFHRDARYATDLWKAEGVDAIAESVSQHQEVFAYRFDADDWRNLGVVDLKDLFGASHAFEIPFMFGYFPKPSRVLYPDSMREEFDLLSRTMMSYWAAFAYHGDPGEGLSEEETRWLPWRDSDSGHFLILDTESDGGVRMTQEVLSVDEIKAAFKADTSFASLDEKCRAYEGVFWGDLYDPYEYEALGCR